MKFRVTMKDPDGIYDCTQDALKADVAAIPGLSQNDRDALLETRGQAVGKVMRRFFEYGDYCVIEVDTDAGTATVVEVSQRPPPTSPPRKDNRT